MEIRCKNYPNDLKETNAMYKLLTRSELYEMVWEQPATKVATELEISDVAVAKICRKLHIPAHHEHPFWFNVNTYSGLT